MFKHLDPPIDEGFTVTFGWIENHFKAFSGDRKKFKQDVDKEKVLFLCMTVPQPEMKISNIQMNVMKVC